MYFYYGIVLLIVVVGCFEHQRIVELSSKKNNNIDFSNKREKYILLFFTIFFIIIIGCRSYSVGNDAWNYKITYEKYSNFHSFDQVKQIKYLEEPGYVFLIILLNRLGASWNLYFIIATSIYIIPFMLLVHTESNKKIYSLALFMLNGYFLFPMSTMRQSMATGFCIIGYIFLKKRKTIICLLFFLIAITFHTSAIIVVLFYFFYFINLSSKNLKWWILCFAGVVIFGLSLFRGLFINALSLLGKEYAEVETGGLFREAYFVISVIIVVIVGSTNNEYVENNSFEIKGVLLSSMLLPIIRYNPALSRSYMYFSLFEIILIPNTLKYIKKVYVRYMGLILYFVTGYYFLYTQLATRRLIPYKFFWQQ